MLSLTEFGFGYLSDAEPLSLIKPFSMHDETILIGRNGSKKVAAFFIENECHQSFEYEENNSYSGMLIPNVAIEVDETSFCNIRNIQAPAGALVRHSTKLSLYVAQSPNYGRVPYARTIFDKLPEYPEYSAVGFTRWQISIGHGIEKRVLKKVDLKNKQA